MLVARFVLFWVGPPLAPNPQFIGATVDGQPVGGPADWLAGRPAAQPASQQARLAGRPARRPASEPGWLGGQPAIWRTSQLAGLGGPASQQASWLAGWAAGGPASQPARLAS